MKFSKYNVNDISGNAKKKRPEPNGHNFPMIQVASNLLINYVPDTEFILFLTQSIDLLITPHSPSVKDIIP